MWAVNCLSALAGFITVVLTRGPMIYAVRLRKSYHYRLLHLVGGTFQLWNLYRLHH